MIKFEVTKLHQIAQLGKESCERLKDYTDDKNLNTLIDRQLKTYKDFMHKIEKEHSYVKDIGSFKSVWYSSMMKISLKMNHERQDIINAMIKGNIMGLESTINFISCDSNSKDSKVLASKLLQVININFQEILEECVYIKMA